MALHGPQVLKPGAEDVLAADLTFLLLATRLLQIVSPALERTSAVGIVEDIRTSMLDEARAPASSPPLASPRRRCLV